MYQQLTIRTEDRRLLRPLVESALENERKLTLLGLQQTQARLAEFERQYGMTSAEFERRLTASEIVETVDFSDWRMEMGMLRLLERQYKALQNAKLD